MTSPTNGPSGLRARVGFIPKSPQQLAGMRMEPPPSLACASGTRRAATAAAEPPLEPPVERVGSQGLRAGPKSCDSVVGKIPNSGVFVVPTITRPVRRKRVTSSASSGATKSRSRREPAV